MTAVQKELHKRRRPIFVATLIALAAGMVLVLGATGASLPGSNFEIEDSSPATLPGANLKVDGPQPPSLDWANVAEQRQPDTASGPADESFGQGTKEDTAVPTVVNGSIPPQKSDLKTFGVYLEENASGRFLNLFWHRVQEPNGTTNMDFEFNKSSVLSANGVTPVRTSGDVLIQYDLSRGGVRPTLFVSRWIDGSEGGTAADCEQNNALPCWDAKENLSLAGDATGSINNVAIPAAESDGLGDISARTFGEAQIDLDALGGGDGCQVFASAYLKSRSSDSFTSELKDFIPPESLDIDQCANVIIRKVTVPPSDPAAVQFGYTKNIATSPATANTFTLGHGQSQEYNTVLLGNDYTVVEDVIPTNWEFTSLDCSASTGIAPEDIQIVGAQVTFDINDASDTLDCTYTNSRRLGAIKIHKDRKHAADGTGNHPHAGVSFTVSNGGTSEVVVTDANGNACVDGLPFGAYTVTESVPVGYASDDAVKEATVNANSDCGDGNEALVSFLNTPLTNITINVDSQVDGGTSSTINCDGVLGQTGANGDGQVARNNLPPGEYHCTVVVDP
jgi:Prealbumin-like fold domain